MTVVYNTVAVRIPSLFPSNMIVPVGAMVLLAPETVAVKVMGDPEIGVRLDACTSTVGVGNWTFSAVAAETELW